MAIFIRSVSGVLIILVMIALGYVLSRRGWFDDQAPKLIARLVTQIALQRACVNVSFSEGYPFLSISESERHSLMTV